MIARLRLVARWRAHGWREKSADPKRQMAETHTHTAERVRFVAVVFYFLGE